MADAGILSQPGSAGPFLSSRLVLPAFFPSTPRQRAVGWFQSVIGGETGGAAQPM